MSHVDFFFHCHSISYDEPPFSYLNSNHKGLPLRGVDVMTFDNALRRPPLKEINIEPLQVVKVHGQDDQ